MPNLTIDRLTLKLSGISDPDGRRLAALIAENLATSASDLPASYHLDSLRATITAGPGDSMESVAKRVTADLLRQLDRNQ